MAVVAVPRPLKMAMIAPVAHNTASCLDEFTAT